MKNNRLLHMWIATCVLISYCLTLAIGVPSSAASTKTLRDISKSYAREQIQSLFAAGVVAGDENGYFHPTSPVTRAEFVAMLNRTIGIKPVASAIISYRDVPKSSWAYGYVQAAASLNIVNGTSATTFSPTRTITREEAAVFLVRALEQKVPQAMNLSSLQDASLISSWAKASVGEAVKKKWLVGYEGKFRPSAALTREETAVILQRILTELKAQTTTAKPMVSLGWQYESTTSEYIAQVQKTGVNTLSPRWFFLQKDGTVSDGGDISLTQWTQKNGKKVWALFGNRFDADATHSAISDATKRKAVIQTVMQYIDKYHLDGINIDFEGFYPNDRDNFTLFTQELATAMHAKGKVLSIDVPPDSGTDWSDPYDYAKLAKYADYLILMAYEEHWAGSPVAGSVASLPWIENIITDVLQEVPNSQLIIGLPLYTRDWYPYGGAMQYTDLDIPESYQLVSTYKGSMYWDDTISQYRATYQKQGITHSIWLEDSRSMGLKVQKSLQWQIGGLAYWSIGSESTDMWQAIANAITLKQARQKM